MDPLEHIINFLKQADEQKVGISLLDVFRKHSTNVEQLDQLGKYYYELKDYKKSISCVSDAIAIASNPNHLYSLRANLAKLYNNNNEPEKSIIYSSSNLNVSQGQDYNAKIELVFSHYLLGDMQKSYALTKELIEDENTPEEIKQRSLFNLGTYQMDEGNFKEGIRNFIDVGHKIGIWKTPELKNMWDGSHIENGTIAIFAEGGIGDEIINVRFMRKIEEMGMAAIWYSGRKEIAALFNRNGFKTVTNLSEIPEDAKWCYSFYLPILLDLDKDQLDIGTYLQPDIKYIEKWETILPEGEKIAIRWAGNPLYEQDLHRSIPLKELVNNLNCIEGKKLISVQKDTHIDELKDYPEIFDASPYLETLEDLIACLYWCETTISSCTSVAHISAASGNKTIVTPPIACYYVWLDSGNEWYGDNVKVYRQRKLKDWTFIRDICL